MTFSVCLYICSPFRLLAGQLQSPMHRCWPMRQYLYKTLTLVQCLSAWTIMFTPKQAHLCISKKVITQVKCNFKLI